MEYHGGAVPEDTRSANGFASPFANLDALFTPAAEDAPAAGPAAAPEPPADKDESP